MFKSLYSRHVRILVSIPSGTIKIQWRQLVYLLQSKVSIPSGTIKINNFVVLKLLYNLFQFHLVRLKLKKCAELLDLPRFQFHLVRLKY